MFTKLISTLLIGSVPVAALAGFSSSKTPPINYPNSQTQQSGYYSGQQSANQMNGYSSSQYNNQQPVAAYQAGYILQRNTAFRWVPMRTGYSVPVNAVAGGMQYNPRMTLYVCRASFQDGVHPGKLIGGQCNISWGGQEISLSSYEVLISPNTLAWVGANNGGVPRNAIPGGYENGRPLFICQAQFKNGVHTGKVVGQTCHFGWYGREVTLPYYYVLVA